MQHSGLGLALCGNLRSRQRRLLPCLRVGKANIYSDDRDPRMGERKLGVKGVITVVAERLQMWSTDFLTPPPSSQGIAKNLGITKM